MDQRSATQRLLRNSAVWTRVAAPSRSHKRGAHAAAQRITRRRSRCQLCDFEQPTIRPSFRLIMFRPMIRPVNVYPTHPTHRSPRKAAPSERASWLVKQSLLRICFPSSHHMAGKRDSEVRGRRPGRVRASIVHHGGQGPQGKKLRVRDVSWVDHEARASSLSPEGHTAANRDSPKKALHAYTCRGPGEARARPHTAHATRAPVCSRKDCKDSRAQCVARVQLKKYHSDSAMFSAASVIAPHRVGVR